MAKLIIYRGLPGSGKTTEARQFVDAAEPGTLVRLNRDDFRRSMLARGYGAPVYAAEERITAARDAALAALLTAGCDVICDDTNLRAKYVRSLMEIAQRASAEVEIVDLSAVPLEECIRRDALRSAVERVGEKAIRDMHARYLAQLNCGPLPIPEVIAPMAPKARPYSPVPGMPKAVLCDVDGTVALLDRSPYDETKVITDRPNKAVIETLRALIDAGHIPVFMSGRTEACRADTATWLIEHVCPELVRCPPELHMRTAGDTRPDHVVKLELFDARVRDRWDVRMVLDDRDSVVALWRSMGLTCLQVAPGAF